MTPQQALKWLDDRVADGRGVVTLGGNDFDGSPSVFMGDVLTAVGTGETVLEAIADAADNWKGWPT